MKLPEFKEQQGTSMASAMMTPAQRPNIKPHQAAIQRFYPKENPDDYIRLANAQGRQYQAFAGAVNTVAGAIGKLYESNDNANANAAAAHVKRGVAEFVTNAKRNTQYEVTDPVTGQTVKPWDVMDQTFNDHVEMLKEEAREKYGFSMRSNNIAFDTTIEGYKSTGSMDLGEHGFKLKRDDTQAKAMEDIASTDSLSELQTKLTKYEMEGTFSRVEGYKQEMQFGAKILSAEYMRAFIGADNQDIANIEQAIRNDPRASKYLDPDDLEKSLENWKNSAAKDGLIRSLDAVRDQLGDTSFDDQLLLVETLGDIPLEQSGFATETDRYNALYTQANRIDQAKKAHLKQFGITKKQQGYIDDFSAFMGDGSAELSEDGLHYALSVQHANAIHHLKSTGQEYDPEQVYKGVIAGNPKRQYMNIFPGPKANQFRNALHDKNALRDRYKDYMEYWDLMPAAGRMFNSKHNEFLQLHLLLGEPDANQRQFISPEAIQQAVEMIPSFQKDPTQSKNNQAKWASMKKADDELETNTLGLLGIHMGMEIDWEENPVFQQDVLMMFDEYAASGANADQIAKLTANRILFEWTPKSEGGVITYVKGDARSFYKNRDGGTTAEQKNLIDNDLTRQERDFATKHGMGQEYENGNIIFKNTGASDEAGRPTAFMLLRKETEFGKRDIVVADPFGMAVSAMRYYDPAKAIVDPEKQSVMNANSQYENKKRVEHLIARFGDGKSTPEDYKITMFPEEGAIGKAAPFVMATAWPITALEDKMVNTEEKLAFRMYGSLLKMVDQAAVAENLEQPQVEELRQQVTLYMQLHHGMDAGKYIEALDRGFNVRKQDYVEQPPRVDQQTKDEMYVSP